MDVSTFFYERPGILGSISGGKPKFFGQFVLSFKPEAGDLFEFEGRVFSATTVYTRFDTVNGARTVVILIPSDQYPIV